MFIVGEFGNSSASSMRDSNTRALETAAQVWLMLGVGAVLCVPALRGSNPMIGWLPFWFIVAPLIDLAVLRRHRLAAASRAFLVRSRRRRAAPRQARSLRRRAQSLRRCFASHTAS